MSPQCVWREFFSEAQSKSFAHCSSLRAPNEVISDARRPAAYAFALRSVKSRFADVRPVLPVDLLAFRNIVCFGSGEGFLAFISFFSDPGDCCLSVSPLDSD